ncbi:helicase, partial [Bacillus thuringiensis]|nr:helicase [Bacillus thuringiensis]
MALDVSKCGKKTAHLKSKETGKHYAKALTCNKLECPRCQPVIAAHIQKMVRFYSQRERLFFFNTLTSTDGIKDLDKIFSKIRNELNFNFTLEGYMKRKKVSYEKALKWYEKKKEKTILSDVEVELFRISRYDAVISVAKRKKVYYKNLSSDDKAKFKDIYSDLIYERFLCIYDCKCKDQSL